MPMNKYVEDVLLNIKVNKTELEKIQEDFNKLKIPELLSPEAKQSLKESYIDAQKRALQLQKINKELIALQNINSNDAEQARAALMSAKQELELEDVIRSISKEKRNAPQQEMQPQIQTQKEVERVIEKQVQPAETLEPQAKEKTKAGVVPAPVPIIQPAQQSQPQKVDVTTHVDMDEIREKYKSGDDLKELKNVLESLKKNVSPEAKELKSKLETRKKELESNEFSTSLKSGLKKGVQEGLIEAGKKAWKAIEDVAIDVWNTAKEMMQDIAAYSSNSRVFSQEATDLKLNYGLSGAEAYAAQQASKDTKFGSFDNFIQQYAFAEEETKQRWQELFQKYQQTYEQDVEIALAFQEFETEWTDFKKEMSMELINFFMENKDSIKAIMKALIKFMEVGIEVFGGLLKWLGDGVRGDEERTAATSDILQNYVNNNTQNYNNKTVSVSNTFNGVQTSDRTELINAGSLTYSQIMKALE